MIVRQLRFTRKEPEAARLSSAAQYLKMGKYTLVAHSQGIPWWMWTVSDLSLFERSYVPVGSGIIYSGPEMVVREDLVGYVPYTGICRMLKDWVHCQSIFRFHYSYFFPFANHNPSKRIFSFSFSFSIYNPPKRISLPFPFSIQRSCPFDDSIIHNG